MKITGYGPIGSTGGTRKTGKASQPSSFADILAASETEETAQSAPAGDVAATALNNLLSLQEISEEDIRRRKLVQRGNTMLDVLEQLRRRLLMGTLPPQLLRDLDRQLSVHKQEFPDPRLTALIEDIELLAAVELAKLEMALKGGIRE